MNYLYVTMLKLKVNWGWWTGPYVDHNVLFTLFAENIYYILIYTENTSLFLTFILILHYTIKTYNPNLCSMLQNSINI